MTTPQTAQSVLNDVERACVQLRRDSQPVTFTAIAAATGIARSTLYRNTAIRALINEQRHRDAASGTLTGLTDEIATLRTIIDELAARVRRHEEQLRRLTRD